MKNRHALALTHIGVAIAAFAVASSMGVLQAMSVADVDFPRRTGRYITNRSRRTAC